MLCSKLHCQKVLNRNSFPVKSGDAGGKHLVIPGADMKVPRETERYGERAIEIERESDVERERDSERERERESEGSRVRFRTGRGEGFEGNRRRSR